MPPDSTHLTTPAVTRWAIHRPRTTLLFAFLCVAAALPGLLRLELRTDGHALVPEDAPEVVRDRALREDFGLCDQVAIIIQRDAPGGIYDAHTISLVAQLTQSLQGLEGVRPYDVFSLATEQGHRVRQGTLQFLTLLDPLPQTPEQLATLRDDVRKIRLFDGTLVSDDEKSTTILVSVPPGMDRMTIQRSVQHAIRGLGTVPEKISVTGAPVAEALLGTHILQDLGVPSKLLGERLDWEAYDDSPLPRSFEGLRIWLARHIGLLPIALLVMCIVFLASFRSIPAAALTMLKTGCSLLIVFGIMGWAGTPIYLTIAVMPVILTATGVSHEVHIFSAYAQKLAESPTSHPDRAGQAMRAAMGEIWLPVVIGALTTAIGFLSFALSPLAPVQAFGLFTAIGTIISMIWGITATPASAILFSPARFSRKALLSSDGTDFQGRNFSLRLQRWGDAVMRHRIAVVGVFALITAAAWIGIRRIEVQDSWIDGFAPSSAFARATHDFNKHYLGMHTLYVCVDTNGLRLSGMLDAERIDHFTVTLPPGAVKAPQTLVGGFIRMRPAVSPPGSAGAAIVHDTRIESAVATPGGIVLGLQRMKGSPRFSLNVQPGQKIPYEFSTRRLGNASTLRHVDDLRAFIAGRKSDQVGGVLGPVQYLETTRYLSQGRRDEFRTLPEDGEQIAQLWNWYGSVRGIERLRQLIDEDQNRCMLSVQLTNANFVDTKRLLAALRSYEKNTLAPRGMSIELAGDVAVSQALIDGITRTQINSVALSILGVLLSAMIVHRSVRWGILCALPCALAVPLVFGVMGFAGIPLGVATSMFAAMAIGIGDDYAVHFVERYRLLLAKFGDARTAMLDTLSTAGPAIAVNALSVGLGFGVMILSQVPSNARLATMLVASIIVCLFATLTLLPAVIRLMGPRGKLNEMTFKRMTPLRTGLSAETADDGVAVP